MQQMNSEIIERFFQSKYLHKEKTLTSKKIKRHDQKPISSNRR